MSGITWMSNVLCLASSLKYATRMRCVLVYGRILSLKIVSWLWIPDAHFSIAQSLLFRVHSLSGWCLRWLLHVECRFCFVFSDLFRGHCFAQCAIRLSFVLRKHAEPCQKHHQGRLASLIPCHETCFVRKCVGNCSWNCYPPITPMTLVWPSKGSMYRFWSWHVRFKTKITFFAFRGEV